MIALAVFSIGVAYYYFKSTTYNEPIRYIAETAKEQKAEIPEIVVPIIKKRVVTHIKTPEAVKAV